MQLAICHHRLHRLDDRVGANIVKKNIKIKPLITILVPMNIIYFYYYYYNCIRMEFILNLILLSPVSSTSHFILVIIIHVVLPFMTRNVYTTGNHVTVYYLKIDILYNLNVAYYHNMQ